MMNGPSLEAFYNTTDLKRFFCPTRLVWGEAAGALLPRALAGAQGVLAVLDAGIAEDPRVRALLAEAPLLGEIRVGGEPDSAFLDGCVASLPPGVDALLCIGGGSTLDAGKAIRAHLAYGRWAVKDLAPLPGMPRLVAVPTVAASGSEMSRYYVITDAPTHEKRAYRSWSLAPDVALLDPLFLETVPPPLRFAGALDAFTHLYESLLCRQERSWFNDALCREGLGALKALAPRLMEPGPLASGDAQRLQYAAALGGLALSNVRTGLLHDAGEALAAQVDLAHPLTLRVFLPALLALHGEVLAERLGACDLEGGWGPYWLEGFRRLGLDAPIHAAFAARRPEAGPIVAKILADRVLLEKESPVPLDEATVRAFVETALGAVPTLPGDPA